MEKSSLEEKAIKGAIQNGLKELVKRNRFIFSGMEDYLNSHINSKKVSSKISELYKVIKEKKMGNIESSGFLYHNLKKYIASGSMLDIKGEKSLLEKGLEGKTEEKGFFGRLKDFFKYFTRPKEQKYLERTLSSANFLYNSFVSNNFDINPKFGAYLKEMNALYPFLELMKEKKVIEKDKVRKLYDQAAKAVEKRTNEFREEIKKYAAEKIASAILGIAGISLIAVSLKITGAVIGISNSTSLLFAGMGMAAASLILAFSLIKKKQKKIAHKTIFKN